MTALTRIDNPIAWQELIHQERTAPRFLRRWWVLGPFVLVLMVAGVAITLTQVEYATRELGIYMIWIVHTATALRALIAGANVISREHVGQTWDSLVLTGISARQIMFGKWRAALHRSGPWMVALGTIRLAMIPIFFLALANVYAWGVSYYSRYSSYGYEEYPMDVTWVPWAALLAVLSSIVLSILDVMACTAIGMAASAVTRRGILAGVVALSIRFAPVAIFGAFTRYELGGGAHPYRVLRFAPFAIADGGTSTISRLSVPLTGYSQITHIDALGGLVLAALSLVVMIVVALMVAWLAIRLTGALPEPERVPVASDIP
ncbi:MAG: hypothetical protein IT324_26230 [Anaerolineae bacterium]|nr:hypothetical protein [Anaerolineae bacterium]